MMNRKRLLSLLTAVLMLLATLLTGLTPAFAEGEEPSEPVSVSGEEGDGEGASSFPPIHSMMKRFLRTIRAWRSFLRRRKSRRRSPNRSIRKRTPTTTG
ncbi:MAG: hypothetical protein Q4B07_05990 [Clostridia bacterium]|nr:hypothetical protein [Clostridia bacterium]